MRHGEDIINGRQGGMCDMVKTSSTVGKEDVRHGEDIINGRQGGMCDMVKTSSTVGKEGCVTWCMLFDFCLSNSN